MIVAGSASPLLLSSAGGYNLTKSLRFRASASAYLNRTLGSSGSLRAWTWSAWVKRGTLGVQQDLFGWVDLSGGNFQQVIGFNSDNTLEFQMYNSALGGYVNRKTTSQVFRDPSAWYHIVVTWDSNNATADDRARIYINGTRVTAWANNTNPSLNQDSYINNSSYPLGIGRCMPSSSNYFDGYLTEINFVNAQALDATSFGETSTSTGVWIPKKYTGTYGTNGFYLPFTDVATTSGSNAGLGKDFSGNGNYWTTNNISVTSGSTYDSMKDVPTLTDEDTANYAVLNPLWRLGGSGYITPTNGNLRASIGGTNNIIASTIPLPTTGKWYMEFTLTTAVYPEYGLCSPTANGGGGATNIYGAYFNGTNLWFANGANGSSDGNFANTTGDIGLIAVDVDNNKLWIGRNRSGTVVWMGGGNPSSGTSPSFSASGGGGVYATTFNAQTFNNPFIASGAGSDVWDANFGQQPWVGTPPTGFKALNTYNLPTPTIGATATTQANKYFDATTFTGNASTNVITNSGSMQPDMVWLKSRSNANNHTLYDALRGVNTLLYPNLTNAEAVGSAQLTSFNSNGFTLGANENANDINGESSVGWQWRASNATGVTNTAGSITSTVSANTTAGFSIVTGTLGGVGVQDTVGHGLGVAPKMIIFKTRSGSTYNWSIYHASVCDTTSKYFRFTTDALQTYSTTWGAALPTSTVFGVTGDGCGSPSNPFVAYCFAEVAGYSAFGSYTGNGSSDGPFVFTGFRPRFLIVKRTNDIGSWIMTDSARSTYNVTGELFNANTSGAEFTTSDIKFDYLSNGFKLREVNGAINASGSTYIYMAFAESPFKYANAR